MFFFTLLKLGSGKLDYNQSFLMDRIIRKQRFTQVKFTINVLIALQKILFVFRLFYCLAGEKKQ